MEKQKIAVYLGKLVCKHDTHENKHDDIYFHLYSYDEQGNEEDLGSYFWERPLKMNDTGDNEAYVDIEVGVDTEYVERLRISMREKDTKSDSASAEANHNNWQLIEDVYLDRDAYKDKLTGTLDFHQQSGKQEGYYTLDYRIINAPIPTLRVLGVYCEQNTQKDDGRITQAVLGLAEEACEAASKAMKKSPRPRAQLISDGFKAASYVFKGIQGFTSWIGGALEGDDDVYMQQIDAGDAGADGGGFFPPAPATSYKMHKVDYVNGEPQYVPGENVSFFLEEYGKYFRIPLDQGDVTVQLKDADRGSDDAIGAITITESDYERLKNEGAQIEVASEYYEDNGNGAVYYICYSVGIEDWSSNATPEDQGDVPEDWGVKLYPYQNQQGIPMGLAKGEYSLNNSYNNQVESLEIKEGHQAMLYTTSNHTGAIRVETSTKNSLGSWNNQTSSIVVQEIGKLPPHWAAEIFKDGNYTGSHVWLTEGYYDKSLSNFDNQISSIKLNTGYYAIAYMNEHLDANAGFILTESQPNLSSLNVNLNDSIERLYILKEGETLDKTGAITFSDTRYQGFSQVLSQDAYYHNSGGIYDEDFKSVRISDGFQITLYENGISNIPCIIYKKDVADLHQPDGYSNELRVQHIGTPPPSDWIAKCYTRENYQGHMMVLPEGEFNFEGFFNHFNNKVKSIEIRDDYQMALYDSRELGGKPFVITESQSSLGNMNNKVSSVKINLNPTSEDYYIARLELDINGKRTTKDIGVGDHWIKDIAEESGDIGVMSVTVQEGYTAQLFMHPSLPGQGISCCHGDDSVDVSPFGPNLYKFISVTEIGDEHVPGECVAMIYHTHSSGYQGLFYHYPEMKSDRLQGMAYPRCCAHRVKNGYIFTAYSDYNFDGEHRDYEGNCSDDTENFEYLSFNAHKK